MAKTLHRLTVKRIDAVDPGTALNDGGGLFFRCTGPRAGKWAFRFTSADPAFVTRQEAAGRAARQRELGLGTYPGTGLALAREKAAAARALVVQGLDPIEEAENAAEAAKRAARARQGAVTFAAAVDEVLRVKLDGFRNEKHRYQWRQTLIGSAVPIIGHKPVQDITVQDVQRVLMQDVLDPEGEVIGPLWRVRTETASRLRGRIETVLSWATVAGHRAGDNPARWQGNLKELLADPSKIATPEHLPCLAVEDAPRWFADLRRRTGMGARALEFLAMTAARSGEVRGMTWAEVDLDKGLWVVPASRMKAGREHRVPLSAAAVALLRALPRQNSSTLVFPAERAGQLSDMTLRAVARRMHEADVAKEGKGYVDPKSGRPVVPHGLRSTFRVWAAERGYDRDMAEMQLAHSVGTDVERAYRRTDFIERRRAMVAAWVGHLEGVTSAGVGEAGGNIVAFATAGA